MADFLFQITYLLNDSTTVTVGVDVSGQPNLLKATEEATAFAQSQQTKYTGGRAIASIALVGAIRPQRAIDAVRANVPSV